MGDNCPDPEGETRGRWQLSIHNPVVANERIKITYLCSFFFVLAVVPLKKKQLAQTLNVQI